jgi:RNA polymerase sigma-70 factor, ECF subfamily
MPGSGDDGVAILDRVLAGDRLAFLKLNRLVTRFLVQLRAYDFSEEWDDLRQEVAFSVIANARAGRLHDADAFVGYVRINTRNKMVDRLKVRLRRPEHETVAWQDGALPDAPAAPPLTVADEIREVWGAVRELPVEQQRVLDGVYRQGKTYDAVSAETGVPVGTMRRRLRDALVALRRRFMSDVEAG